ncbi:hypothetical protein Q9L58_010685, partial [Maublancomyces gigas]
WYEFVNPNCITDPTEAEAEAEADPAEGPTEAEADPAEDPIEAEADPAEDPTGWSEGSAESVDVIGIGALGDSTGTSGGKISPH